MPIYVYECQGCQVVFELEQRITDDPITICTTCATGTVKRVIQKPLIAFKGEGFHINDYAPKTGEAAPAPSRATSESTPSSAGNDSGTAKTEPHSN